MCCFPKPNINPCNRSSIFPDRTPTLIKLAGWTFYVLGGSVLWGLTRIVRQILKAPITFYNIFQANVYKKAAQNAIKREMKQVNEGSGPSENFDIFSQDYKVEDPRYNKLAAEFIGHSAKYVVETCKVLDSGRQIVRGLIELVPIIGGIAMLIRERGHTHLYSDPDCYCRWKNNQWNFQIPSHLKNFLGEIIPRLISKDAQEKMISIRDQKNFIRERYDASLQQKMANGDLEKEVAEERNKQQIQYNPLNPLLASVEKNISISLPRPDVNLLDSFS